MQHRIIDTHIHVWNFAKATYSWLEGNTTILNRNYDLEELEKVRKEAEVTDGILVQAANNLGDTEWMLAVARNHEWIKAVVGWMPLMHPDKTAEALQHYTVDPFFKGVRHLIHDEKDPEWLLQAQVIESLQLLAENNIPFDLVGVLPSHIKTALRLAEKIPSLKMVFDHLNQPPVLDGSRFGIWGELMKEAAGHPQFHAKISGLGTAASKTGWSAATIKPCVAYVLEHFGAERCFCGGDWPVSLLAGSYSDTWKIYRKVINELANEEMRSKIYFSNAAKFYDLVL